MPSDHFSSQLLLDFPVLVDQKKESFVTAPCNEEAFGVVNAWPDWSSRFQALCGASKSGKSHLAEIWRHKSGAHSLPANTLEPDNAKPFWLLDIPEFFDIHQIDQEKMFHIYNRIHNEQGWLLIVSSTPPLRWPSHFADLTSRLRSIPVVRIGNPDDFLLEKVLKKLFLDRQLNPAPNLFPYLLKRVERSLQSMFSLVEMLDEAGLAAGRPITIALAHDILEKFEGN